MNLLNEKNYSKILWIAFFVSLLLVLFGSQGVRGTDQYWYLADVESLVKSSSIESNVYYPGVIQDNGINSPNYIIHNGPPVHIVSWLASIIGEYTAWITLNILSHLLVAFTIFKVSAYYTSSYTAKIVSALYLLSPVAIWQTMNIVQEQIFAGLTAALLLLYFYRSNVFSMFLFFGLLCVGVLSHPMYFLFAMFSVVIFSYDAYRKSEFRKIFLFLGITALVLYLQTQKSVIFPSSFQPDIESIIAGSAPGKTNMLYQYSTALPDVNMTLIKDKVISAFSDHVLDVKKYPIYVFTNLALLLAPWLLVKRWLKPDREIILPCVILLGMYVGIICLMQSQLRYQQLVAPAVFILIALWAHDYHRHIIVKAAVCTLLIVSLSVSSAMSLTARTQSFDQQLENEKILEQLLLYPTEAKVVLLNTRIDQELRLAYLARPRKVLVINTTYLSNTDAINFISEFAPDYLISAADQSQDHEGLLIETVGDVQSIGYISNVEMLLQTIKN